MHGPTDEREKDNDSFIWPVSLLVTVTLFNSCRDFSLHEYSVFLWYSMCQVLLYKNIDIDEFSGYIYISSIYCEF